MSVANYAKHFSTKKTPQSSPIPGSNQVPNSAGGFTWAVDDWKRLDRFLILGNEGGSYYASEKTLTVANAQCVLRCLQADPLRTVNRIVEISDSGRAPKNDPAIFALAMACGQKNKPPNFLAAAHTAIPKVCRIGTHLFSFIEAVKQFRGFGRGLRNSIANWYNEKDPKDLAFQVTKYQQRNGWSHRDLLRLSHAKPWLPDHQVIFHWIVKGWDSVGDVRHPSDNLLPIWAMEKAKRTKNPREIVKLIQDYGLVREHIPTDLLNNISVWEALLEKMPMTAMIRNLATMTRIGLLSPMSNGTSKVISELGNSDRLKKSRIHPIAVLSALLTYQQGHGGRGHNTWSPVAQVVDALDRAFYASFGNVDVAGKRWMLALDVSGSMEMGSIAGIPGLTPRVASGALALITAAVEPLHTFVAFTSSGWGVRRGQWSGMGFNNGLTPLTISPRQRLDDVCRQVSALPMGGTDCALPMLYATEQKIPIDVFVILTDNETWANPKLHPSQALVEYRNKLGIDAKLITVGMTATNFTIADPNDAGQLDVVGFDSATPQLMAEFAKGEF